MLPVSGIELVVREPTGHDELDVMERALAPVPALLGFAGRVAVTVTGDQVDWPGLPVTDLAAAALIIRRSLLGDMIATDTRCQAQGCGERIDVGFRIGDYLGHHRPRRARGVIGAPEAGWFTLTGTDVRFRIPSVGDLLAAQSQAAPAQALASRCISPPVISRALARRLDRALSALAPSLDDLIGGSCPACGRDVALRFDPVSYALADFRAAFSGIHLEIHAIAAAYGWPEEAILALPRSRRRHYSSIIAGERLAA